MTPSILNTGQVYRSQWYIRTVFARIRTQSATGYVSWVGCMGEFDRFD